MTIIEDKIPEIVLQKFVSVEVNPLDAQLSNCKYLKKLTNIFFGNSSPQGDEKNILFYGLTKKIVGLWKCNYESRYNDNDRKKILDCHNADEVISDKYCQYMLGNWQFQERRYLDSKTPSILRKLECNTTFPYKTLAGLKTGTYKLSDNTGNTIELEIRFKVGSRRQNLEELLLLHVALKQERNNCNHASGEKKRLPLEIVSRAIGEYVERFRDLLDRK